MRLFIAVCLVVYAACCYAQEPVSVIVESPRRVVVNAYTSAQAHAQHLAATGTFGHCGRRGPGHEGIGFSSVSADDAVRRCCYWGKLRVREIGTAWCPLRRGWVAVVRYE